MKSVFNLSTITLMIIVGALLIIFTSTSCGGDNSIPDICENITCLNTGQCVNGVCSCPENYEGPACENQKTPSCIRIKKIEVLKFPEIRSNGASWDAIPRGPRADIQIGVFHYEDSNNASTILQTTRKMNRKSDQENIFKSDSFSSNRCIDLPLERHRISIYDWDPTQKERMASINFHPYDNTNDFPEVIELENSKVHFQLTVEYTW